MRMKMNFKIFNLISKVFARSEPNTIQKSENVRDDEDETLSQEVREYVSYLKAFQVSTWSYSALYAIMVAGASVPLKVQRILKDEVENIPLPEPLANPNIDMSFYDLIEATLGFLELTGNAYWELVFDDQAPEERKLSEIYILKPSRIEIIPDARLGVKEYKYEVNNRKIIFSPEEIVHFKYFNPDSDYYGFASLRSAESSINLDKYAVDFNISFFQNRAEPEGFLVIPEFLTDEQYKRLMKRLEKRHRGPKRAHKLEILEGGAEYKQVGLSQKDMEFSQLRRMNREEILAATGVPPVLCGLLEYSSYANAFVQTKLFYQQTIIPKLKKIENKINKQVLPLIDKNLKCYFDYSEIGALQEDKTKEASRLVSLVNAGILDPDEARKELGLEARSAKAKKEETGKEELEPQDEVAQLLEEIQSKKKLPGEPSLDWPSTAILSDSKTSS